MLEDYKKFLKENKEVFYTLFSGGAFVILFFLIMWGSMMALSNIDRNYSNNKELSVYRENLATYQKCAEKIEDASLIPSYCGDVPSKPILIW